MNKAQVRQVRSQLLKMKGKKMRLAEVDGKRVYGVIDHVGKDYVELRMARDGKVVRTKFFFPFFGFPFFSFFNFFPFFFF
jgi:ferredoxin-fold anticodon binding domain-containing protein